MTSDLPFSLPKQPGGGSRRPERPSEPLDGEVIPPTIKVINAERQASPPPPAAQAGFRLRLSTVLLGLGVLALSGAGAFQAYRLTTLPTAQTAAAPDPTILALNRLQEDLGRLKTSVDSSHQDETVRALKKSVDVLKAEFDGLRSNDAAAMAQLNAKLDKPAHDPNQNLSEVMARIDKLDHDPRLADIASRLDRIEHQVSSSTPTGSISNPAHAPAAQSIVAQNPGIGTMGKPLAMAKPAVLDNWIVRDVYSGIALVEGRTGGVREVVPGEVLPGAGEVRSIERRGGGWIVVTSRGIIDTETW